jgi:hypothetical protein
MKRKDKSVNLRLPEQLLEAVRRRAQDAGIPYQRFIRLALERAVQGRKQDAGKISMLMKSPCGQPDNGRTLTRPACPLWTPPKAFFSREQGIALR